MEFGGQDITIELRKLLADRHINIELADAKLLKERIAFVRKHEKGYSNFIPPENEYKDDFIRSFELPDGTEIICENKILADACELLCKNDKFLPKGLVEMTYDSIRLCDDSINKELTNNIIIAGGTSMLQGIVISTLNTMKEDMISTLNIMNEDDILKFM